LGDKKGSMKKRIAKKIVRGYPENRYNYNKDQIKTAYRVATRVTTRLRKIFKNKINIVRAMKTGELKNVAVRKLLPKLQAFS